MTQNEYMNLMDYYFRNSDQLVYEEIKKDFEEHFRQGLEEGKSEEEIVRELGDPKEIYNEYKAEGIIEENTRFDFSVFSTFIDDITEKFNKKKTAENLSQNGVTIPQQVHRIEISSDGFDISLKNHNENSIQVNYMGEKNAPMPIQLKGTVLKIGTLEANRLLKAGEGSFYKNLEILIPENSDMGINIWSIGGKVDISVLNNDITIRSGRGEINCYTKGKSVSIDSAFANVKLGGSQKEIFIKTATGNIDINSRTPDMDINTVSGKIKARIVRSNNLKMRSVSSDIVLKMVDFKGKARISSMSGEILLGKDDKETSKKHGKFLEERWSDDVNKLHISSVSGNIIVEKF